MTHSLAALATLSTPHAVGALATPNPHAFGVGRGFAVLVVLFGGALGVMMLVGHLRETRRQRRHRGSDVRR